MRVLVLCYSQTGDSARVAHAISEPLAAAGHHIQTEHLRPVANYPFPWRNLITFFNVLPECLLGPPPAMQPVAFDPAVEFDLVILVYQVWFLAPSLPTQGFLASPAVEVLRNRPIITVCVSRNMWTSASEQMKRRLLAADARQIDNVVVTHQGPPWATFITTPRWLLFGKSDPFWGIFPQAGIGDRELQRVRRMGELIRDRWRSDPRAASQSLLQNAGAVTINRRYLVPELIGWYLFVAWAHVLKGLGRLGTWPRRAGVCGFIFFLVCAVTVGIPIVALGTAILTPLVRRPLASFAKRVAAPSGSDLSRAVPSGIIPSESVLRGQ